MPRAEWLALRDRLGLKPGSSAHLLPRKVTRFSSEDIDPGRDDLSGRARDALRSRLREQLLPRAVDANEQVLLADAELGADRLGRAVLDDAQPHRVAQRRRQAVDAGEDARELLALLGDLVGSRLAAGDGVAGALGAVVVVERFVVAGARRSASTILFFSTAVSQERSAARPPKRARPERTASMTSWTASSASAGSRSFRRAKRTR